MANPPEMANLPGLSQAKACSYVYTRSWFLITH